MQNEKIILIKTFDLHIFIQNDQNNDPLN